MARNERRDDRIRGGVGTMTRPGARQRPPQAPEAAPAPARPEPRARTRAPWRVPPAERVTGPQPRPTGPQTRVTGPQTRVTGPQPRVTGPQPAAPQQRQAGPAAQAARPAEAGQRAGRMVVGSHRMPFVLLLCGLLGGALVSALVISTTLAEGSFQISKLQDSTSALARQRQTLEEQVAQAQSAQQIAQQATKLGMRRPGELRYINLKTGKMTNDGPTWIGAVNAPGYVP